MSVTQIALYKVEEETQEKLVLRQKKIVYLLGGFFLAVMGIVFLWAGLTARHETSAGIIAVDIIGVLFFVGGAALIRAGIRNKSRIIFDRGSRSTEQFIPGLRPK